MDTPRDLRLALRDLLKSPGYTSAAIVTLALTIGANSAIFSAVYAVLLKPLPIRQPENLVISWASDQPHHLPVVELSYDNFKQWTANSRSFSQTAAIGSSTWPARLDTSGESERLSLAGVSASFFETLGAVPQIGRTFRADDDVPNAPRVVVLSHGLWVRRFGADPRIVGTTIQMPEPHTVVGVMPEAFDFPRSTDVWTPVVPVIAGPGGDSRADALSSVGVLFVIGRLRDGVTPRMAAEEVDRVAGELARTGASPRFGSGVVVTPFLTYVLGPVRQALWALLAAVGVLLLIGCANVSGLMLTRVSLRRREQAVRVALGATRGALIRHWVLETLVLSVAGGTLGLLASTWMATAIVALAPEALPRLADISINLPVAAFTFGVVFVTALLCGIGPIRHANADNVIDALNEAGRSTPSKQAHRTRSLLLVGQLGLSVVLLVAAGLVVRSFMNLQRTDLGFMPSHVITMSLGPRDPRPTPNQWMHGLLGRLSALPNVEAAGAVYLRPLALGSIGQETSVLLDEQPDTPQAKRENPVLNYQVATPGYFAAMRIALRRGRLFNDDDTERATRVALVSETAARQLWPGHDPLGKRLKMPTFRQDGGSEWRIVVGVVSDVRYRGLDDVRSDVYDAALQAATSATDVVVRTSGDPRRVAAAVATEARRMDPRLIIDRLTTMDAIVSKAVAPWRFGVWMFTVFAGLSVVLATIGLFSLVSLDVAQRRHEFAVRLALGAQRRDILRPVLLVAGGRVFGGLVLGALVSLAASRAVSSLLFGIGPLDLTTYVAAIALMLAVVAVAAYLPARRAADIDPLALLRRE